MDVFYACAAAVAALALVGSLLLTRSLVVERFNASFLVFPAAFGVVALSFYSRRIIDAVMHTAASFGYGQIASGLITAAVLAAMAGFLFAFFPAKRAAC